jgi:hypothetical protein
MGSFRIPPWLGLAVLFGMGALAFVLPAWTDAVVALGKRTGISESWSGFAGGLIGSAVTSIVAAVAIYFAYLGIREQIRAGVLGREEDRLLRELPGLRDAHELLLRVENQFAEGWNPQGIVEEFREVGLGRIDSTLPKEIKALLPDTDDATLMQIRRAVFEAIQSGEKAEAEASYLFSRVNADFDSDVYGTPEFKELERKADRTREAAHEYKAGFRKSLAAITHLRKEIEDRINLYESRLPKIRRQMSAYFDG